MKHINIYLITYVVLIICGVTLLWLTTFIPDKRIHDNVHSSALTLNREGEYPKLLQNPLWKLDNFTDSWMINISYCPDTLSNFKHILLNPYFEADSLSKPAALKLLSDNPNPMAPGNAQYGRYWHGYQIILKPLLCFFNYNGIRLCNSIFIGLLLIWVLIGCYKKLKHIYSIGLVLSVCLFYLPVGPFSLQFSTCFIIALLGSGFLIYLPSIPGSHMKLGLFFFITGAITSFFDLLTTPLLTLGFPLIILGGLKKGLSIKSLLRLSLLWGTGYIGMWAAKWFLTNVFADPDLIREALNQIKYRAVGTIEDSRVITVKHILMPLYAFLIIIGSLFLIRIYAFSSRLSPFLAKAKKNIYLIIIAYYPIFWFVLFSNHSFNHIWFTYRSWAISLFSLILFGYNTLFSINTNEKDSCPHPLPK